MWEADKVTDKLNGYASIIIYLSQKKYKINAMIKHYYDEIEKRDKQVTLFNKIK